MIELILIGHASAFICFGPHRILCDPHLLDGYSRSLFTYCPNRHVNLDALPPPTILFLSHRHRDHFDVRSLDRIHRDTPVICPEDIEIVYALTALGFHDLNPVNDWREIALGEARLIVTPSRYEVPEHGLIVATKEALLWNMVDTVIDSEIIAGARRRIASRKIDLLMWPYQPLKETDAAESRDLSFPAGKFAQALEVLEDIAPSAVLPYADGQFGTGPAQWVNQYRFPVSIEELRSVVAARCPQTQLLKADPGDIVAIRSGSAALAGTVDYIQFLPTAGSRRFDSTDPIPPLRSLGLEAWFPSSREWLAVREIIADRWRSFVASEDWGPFVRASRDWEVSYELIVEDGSAVHGLRFLAPNRDALDFDPRQSTVSKGRAVARVSLGVLDQILEGRLHFVAAYLGGLIRTWEAVYRVQAGRLYRPGRYEDSLPTPEATYFGTILSPATFLNALVNQDEHLWQRVLDHELRGCSLE